MIEVFKHVSLDLIWELPYSEYLMSRFKHHYERGKITTFGLRWQEKNGQRVRLREPIQSPLDYPIDWIGTNPARRGHSVAARRRLPLRSPIEKFFFGDSDDCLMSEDDIFEDLTISREEWERLDSETRASLTPGDREWIALVRGVATAGEEAEATAHFDRQLPPSRLKPFWPQAEAVATRWLEENGCPRRGDGNQAILEKVVADWIDEHGWEAGESTIRRHVRTCIEDYCRRLT